jgi:hypothetical protein
LKAIAGGRPKLSADCSITAFSEQAFSSRRVPVSVLHFYLGEAQLPQQPQGHQFFWTSNQKCTVYQKNRSPGAKPFFASIRRQGGRTYSEYPSLKNFLVF